MVYTQKIQEAIQFAIQVHEVDQKQKRKGKDIAYIGHPLTVALILSQATCSEDVVIAGILHDAVEDCTDHTPVTIDDITEKFGSAVSSLVQSVTEPDGELPWTERKKQAREHIKTFSHDQVLLKSADVLSNGTEFMTDYKKDGDEIFERFHASKEDKIESQLKLIKTLLTQWPENPLASDLKKLSQDINSII